MAGNTQNVEFSGKAFWAKVYKPDEFRGAVRWSLDLYMDDEAEWEKFKKLGIQKKVKENENGKYFQLARPTTKLMKGKQVNFAPPFIYDKDELIVSYVGEDGKWVRSFDEEKVIKRVGDPVLIGNGSLVTVGVSVYPTAMGPGNRMDYVKIIDLITYERPEEKVVEKEEDDPKLDTSKKAKDKGDTTPPW